MTTLPESPTVTLDVDHSSTLTFALEQAGVPIVSSATVRNLAPTPLEGAVLAIKIAPDLGAVVRVPVPTIRGGESLDLGVIDIPLAPGRLRAITEAERARLTWRLPEGVVGDAARLRTRATIGELVFFDSSTIVRASAPPFSAARAVATEALEREEEFVFAIDVRTARLDRYRPLPIRDVAGASGEPADGSRAGGPGVSEARSLLREAAQLRQAEPAPAAARTSQDPVNVRLKQWRDRLLDLSLRNRLLNFRPDAVGAMPLEVPDAALFEDALADEKVFDVIARPAADTRDARDAKLVKARTDDAELHARRLVDMKQGVIHAPLQEAEVRARVVQLDRSARTDLEEGGANTLFAAIGLLRWYESASSDKPRYAPLLLVPVALEYQRTTRRVRLRGLPEEGVPNVTLVEKLQRDFAVDLSGLAGVEADDHGRDVPAMFRAVREAIKGMPRWEVTEQVQLGLFSFTKFLMWRDLGENSSAILESPVVRHITFGQGAPFPNSAPATDPRGLDELVPPARVPVVLDADSTQMAAIVSALAGRCFVLQGPPGTGKSQTIANLIAATLAEGRTVLFVSEKMAALDVVKRRLEQAGLGDFCLELHSHKAQKRKVVESFGKSLERTERAASPPWGQRSDELARVRHALNAYVTALHAARPLGKTFYSATARLLALAGAPRFGVAFRGVIATTEEQLRALLDAADGYARAAPEVDPIATHPYRDAGLVEWSAQGEAALGRDLDAATAAVDAVEDAGRRLAAALGLPIATSVTGLDELAALGAAAASGPLPSSLLDDATANDLRRRYVEWSEQSRADAAQRLALATRWHDSLYEVDVAGFEALFRRWAGAFFVLMWLFLWSARSRLKAIATSGLPNNKLIATDLALARNSLEARKRLAEEHGKLVAAFGGFWSGTDDDDPTPLVARAASLRLALRRYTASSRAPVEQVVALAEPALSPERRDSVLRQARGLADALTTMRSQVAAALSAIAPLAGVWPEDSSPTHVHDARALLSRWREGLPTLRAFSLYRTRAAHFIECGAAPLVAAHQAGSLRAADLVASTERALLQAWVDAVRDSEPALRAFDGTDRHRLVERFRTLDHEHLALGRQRIAEVLEARLPQVDGAVSEVSETGRLQRELRKKARHLPIRRLLTELPNLAARLKPCFLMSPLSVAQYLPPGGRHFDLVVFDEASQICTHDAIGAIARGLQVVVVGDSRQLPPTSFFQRAAGDDDVPDDNDIEELESILDESVAAGLPQQMLGWHYRSRHEALIDFSNEHYYDGRLNVFPAARGRVPELGVEWHPVPGGVYAKGTTRTNRAEAQALVDHLVATLRTTSPQEKTFGVVTFSLAQQLLVQDLLDDARSKAAEIEAHFSSDLSEPVFVKNLESVQGDERDEILFSIGYGPDESGRVWMNFGPLNRSGGERRLNVAITRARLKLRVFSTLSHDQIDLARTASVGARHLKAFLRYVAERGGPAMARPLVRGADFESDFERQVHDALVDRGYQVDCQIGCGSYRIDLAVAHPDRPGVYALGIECDGASYHSAATARDRDRLRHQVLEGLGWRLHRVWSTDWWFSRDREIGRLLTAVQRAIEQGPPAPPQPAAALTPAPPSTRSVTPAPASVAPESGTSRTSKPSPIVPYVRAELLPSALGPDAIHDDMAAREVHARVLQVLAVEAPIHHDELSRRVAVSFGAAKLTERLRARMADHLRSLRADVVVRDGFVWRADQARETWSVIRGASPSGEARSADQIAPEEIAAASAWVLARCLSTTRDDLLRETARAFGILRAGPRVVERMLVGVAMLEQSGRCEVEGDRIHWRGDLESRS